jgi:hypothetical protein
MVSKRIGAALLFLAQLSNCASADVGERKLREAQAAKAKPVMPRRAVPMRTERPFIPAAPAPAPRIVPPTIVAPVPQAPVPITGCDPGGCWGNGNRYQGGTGNTYLDRNGRMCQGNGSLMQCY